MAGDYESTSLSFSKKNSDVWDILTKKKQDEKFNQNDYVCEAIRFYEKNKDKINNSITKEEIKKIVDERVAEILLNSNVQIPKKDIKGSIDLEDIPDDINFDDD